MQGGRQVLAQAQVLAQVLVVLDRLVQAPQLAQQGHVQLPQPHLQKTVRVGWGWGSRPPSAQPRPWPPFPHSLRTNALWTRTPPASCVTLQQVTSPDL